MSRFNTKTPRATLSPGRQGQWTAAGRQGATLSVGRQGQWTAAGRRGATLSVGRQGQWTAAGRQGVTPSVAGRPLGSPWMEGRYHVTVAKAG